MNWEKVLLTRLFLLSAGIILAVISLVSTSELGKITLIILSFGLIVFGILGKMKLRGITWL